MALEPIELPVYNTETITRDYRLRGGFRPVGPMLDYVNDPTRRYAHFVNVSLAAFAAENPLGKRKMAEMMVQKQEIVAISILDQEGVDAAQLLTSKKKLIVYTPRFVIKGDFHMGADEQPMDVLSSGRFDFIGVTDSTLYPLQTVQHGPRIMSSLMLLNRHNVLFYHLADEI